MKKQRILLVGIISVGVIALLILFRMAFPETFVPAQSGRY